MTKYQDILSDQCFWNAFGQDQMVLQISRTFGVDQMSYGHFGQDQMSCKRSVISHILADICCKSGVQMNPLKLNVFMCEYVYIHYLLFTPELLSIKGIRYQ